MTNTQLKGKDYALSGLITVVLGNVVWGVSDVSIKIIGRGQVATFLTGLSGFVFLAIIALITRKPFSPREFLRAFPIGLQRSIIWAGLFLAYQQSNPAIATTIYSFSLVVAIVLFGPLLGEKITSRIVLISLVGVVGVVLTANESFSHFHMSSGSVIVLILLPISAAGTYLLRNLQNRVPAETAPMYYFLWVAILLAPVVLLSHPRYGFTHHEILVIAILGIAGGGGHYLYSVSQKTTTFQFNSIAGSLHSPSTAVCAFWFLGSTLGWSQIVGMIIVIAVVVYISFSTKKSEMHELDENLIAGS